MQCSPPLLPPLLPPPVNYCYCSQAEARARQASFDIHYLEATAETRDFKSKDRLFDPCRIVSKYSRSAAGTSSGGAETGRTFEQLEGTVRHLNMTIWRDDKVGRIEMKYEFVMDRLRAVAQELIIAQERPHPRINTIIIDILRIYCNLLRDIMLYFDQIVDHSVAVIFFLNFRTWFIWENHSKAMRNIISLIVDGTHKAEAAVNFRKYFGEREEIYMVQFLLVCIDKIHFCLCQFKNALPITSANSCRDFAAKMSESGFMAIQLSEHYHRGNLNPDIIHFFSSFYSAIFTSSNLSRAVRIYYEEMYFKSEEVSTNRNVYRKYSGTLFLILISYFRIIRFVGINKSSLSNSTISKVDLAKQLWVIREDLTCIVGGDIGGVCSNDSNSNSNSNTCNSDVLSISSTSIISTPSVIMERFCSRFCFLSAIVHEDTTDAGNVLLNHKQAPKETTAATHPRRPNVDNAIDGMLLLGCLSNVFSEDGHEEKADCCYSIIQSITKDIISVRV